MYSLLQGCLEKGMTHPFGNKLQLKKIAAAEFSAVPQKSCYFGQISPISSALTFRLKSIRTWIQRRFSRFPPCFSYQLVRTTPTKERSPMGKDYSSLILSIPTDLNHGTRLGPPVSLTEQEFLFLQVTNKLIMKTRQGKETRTENSVGILLLLGLFLFSHEIQIIKRELDSKDLS